MLTPADIENKEFKKEMRGYNMTEVNIFLKEVAMSYEKIYQENLSAMDRIGMLSDAVNNTSRWRIPSKTHCLLLRAQGTR